jgi:hypothetical protein
MIIKLMMPANIGGIVVPVGKIIGVSDRIGQKFIETGAAIKAGADMAGAKPKEAAKPQNAPKKQVRKANKTAGK